MLEVTDTAGGGTLFKTSAGNTGGGSNPVQSSQLPAWAQSVARAAGNTSQTSPPPQTSYTEALTRSYMGGSGGQTHPNSIASTEAQSAEAPSTSTELAGQPIKAFTPSGAGVLFGQNLEGTEIEQINTGTTAAQRAAAEETTANLASGNAAQVQFGTNPEGTQVEYVTVYHNAYPANGGNGGGGGSRIAAPGTPGSGVILPASATATSSGQLAQTNTAPAIKESTATLTAPTITAASTTSLTPAPMSYQDFASQAQNSITWGAGGNPYAYSFTVNGNTYTGQLPVNDQTFKYVAPIQAGNAQTTPQASGLAIDQAWMAYQGAQPTLNQLSANGITPTGVVINAFTGGISGGGTAELGKTGTQTFTGQVGTLSGNLNTGVSFNPLPGTVLTAELAQQYASSIFQPNTFFYAAPGSTQQVAVTTPEQLATLLAAQSQSNVPLLYTNTQTFTAAPSQGIGAPYSTQYSNYNFTLSPTGEIIPGQSMTPAQGVAAGNMAAAIGTEIYNNPQLQAYIQQYNSWGGQLGRYLETNVMPEVKSAYDQYVKPEVNYIGNYYGTRFNELQNAPIGKAYSYLTSPSGQPSASFSPPSSLSSQSLTPLGMGTALPLSPLGIAATTTSLLSPYLLKAAQDINSFAQSSANTVENYYGKKFQYLQGAPIGQAANYLIKTIEDWKNAPYNPTQLNLAYAQHQFGSIASYLYHFPQLVMQEPQLLASSMQQANDLANKGIVPWYFPDVVMAMFTIPVITSGVAGAGLSAESLPSGILAGLRNVGLGSALNTGLGAFFGQTSPNELIQNALVGGAAGAVTTPFAEGTPIANMIGDRLPLSLIKTFPTLTKIITRIPQGAVDGISYMVAQTEFSAAQHGQVATPQQLAQAAETGALFGGGFSAASIVGEALAADTGALATRFGSGTAYAGSLATRGALMGGISAGANLLQGSPIPTSEAALLGAAFPFALEGAAAVSPVEVGGYTFQNQDVSGQYASLKYPDIVRMLYERFGKVNAKDYQALVNTLRAEGLTSREAVTEALLGNPEYSYTNQLPPNLYKRLPLLYRVSSPEGAMAGFGTAPIKPEYYVNPETLTGKAMNANPASVFGSPTDIYTYQNALRLYGNPTEAENFALMRDLAFRLKSVIVPSTPRLALELLDKPTETTVLENMLQSPKWKGNLKLFGSTSFHLVFPEARQGADLDIFTKTVTDATELAQEAATQLNEALGEKKYTASKTKVNYINEAGKEEHLLDIHYPDEPPEEGGTSVNPQGANFGLKETAPAVKTQGVKSLQPGEQTIRKISGAATPRTFTQEALGATQTAAQFPQFVEYLKSQVGEGGAYSAPALYRIKDLMDMLTGAKIISDRLYGGALDPQITRLAQIQVDRGLLTQEEFNNFMSSTPEQLTQQLGTAGQRALMNNVAELTDVAPSPPPMAEPSTAEFTQPTPPLYDILTPGQQQAIYAQQLGSPAAQQGILQGLQGSQMKQGISNYMNSQYMNNLYGSYGANGALPFAYPTQKSQLGFSYPSSKGQLHQPSQSLNGLTQAEIVKAYQDANQDLRADYVQAVVNGQISPRMMAYLNPADVYARTLGNGFYNANANAGASLYGTLQSLNSGYNFAQPGAILPYLQLLQQMALSGELPPSYYSMLQNYETAYPFSEYPAYNPSGYGSYGGYGNYGSPYGNYGYGSPYSNYPSQYPYQYNYPYQTNYPYSYNYPYQYSAYNYPYSYNNYAYGYGYPYGYNYPYYTNKTGTKGAPPPLLPYGNTWFTVPKPSISSQPPLAQAYQQDLLSELTGRQSNIRAAETYNPIWRGLIQRPYQEYLPRVKLKTKGM